MFYIVYRTTNKINGKFYIGTHKTRRLDDGYLGSGKLLKRAILKYGVDSFEREVLFCFDNSADMFAKEAEIVTVDFLAESNTYNLKIGGMGGFDYLNSFASQNSSHTDEHMKMMNRVRSMSPSRLKGKKLKESSRLKMIETKSKRPKSKGFTGRSHSEETKIRVGQKMMLKVGDRNSQYDTMWITNGVLNKKVKNDVSIDFGWKRGRTINGA